MRLHQVASELENQKAMNKDLVELNQFIKEEKEEAERLAKEEIERLKQEYENLKKAAAAPIGELGALRKRLEDVEEENNKVNLSLQDMTLHRDVCAGNNRQLQQELSEAVEKSKQLETASLDRNRQIHDLLSHIERLKDELRDCHKELADQEGRLEDLRKAALEQRLQALEDIRRVALALAMVRDM